MSSTTATSDQFYKAKTKYLVLEIKLNDRTSLQSSCCKHCSIHDPVGAVLNHITLYAPKRHKPAKSSTEKGLDFRRRLELGVQRTK